MNLVRQKPEFNEHRQTYDFEIILEIATVLGKIYTAVTLSRLIQIVKRISHYY